MQIIKINKDNRFFREIYKIYEQWHLDSNLPIDKETYTNSFEEEKLPNLYALIINDTLIGMYEINAKDNVDEQEYTPYLANVYIIKRYRNRGYSKLLIEHSISTAKSLNYKALYLHTHHENLYEKYGFKYLKDVETPYGTKRIYKISFKSTK